MDSDGSRYGLIQIPAGGSNTPFHGDLDIAQTRMTITDGREVFAKAVDMMTACSKDALAAAQMQPQDAVVGPAVMRNMLAGLQN